MREHWYRAWHRGSPDGYGHTYVEPTMIYDEWPGECLLFAHQGQPLDPMEYINRKDRNGVKIYEGDLIKNESGRICKVEWCQYTGQWDAVAVAGIRGSDRTGFTFREWEYSVEVVGNVYENPGLMEVTV